MIVRSLALNNFRNYESLDIQFDDGLNILYGDNAQGKTNILEAIYVCGTTKSHKGSKDREMIRMMSETEEAHIRLIIEKKQISHKIDMHLKKNKSKGVAVDGISINKSSELLGLIDIIFFSPEDLNIIKNGPGERRRFLDMELSQIDKLYLHSLLQYNKVLMQRNNLLRQIGLKRELMDTLSVWDEQLVSYGTEIIKSRKEFLEQLNEIIVPLHKKLTGGKETINLVYEPNILPDEFLSKIEHSRERDFYQKTTTAGPHRDDISFTVTGIDLRRYGSQGQQRTAALSLKLAEIALVKQIKKENPVLLLDDVLSELDQNRQDYLLESILHIQTVLTCTGLEDFIRKGLKSHQVYKITEGKAELTSNKM